MKTRGKPEEHLLPSTQYIWLIADHMICSRTQLYRDGMLAVYLVLTVIVSNFILHFQCNARRQVLIRKKNSNNQYMYLRIIFVYWYCLAKDVPPHWACCIALLKGDNCKLNHVR